MEDIIFGILLIRFLILLIDYLLIKKSFILSINKNIKISIDLLLYLTI